MLPDRRLFQDAHPARLELALTIALSGLTAAALVGQAVMLSATIAAAFLQGKALRELLNPILVFLLLSTLRAGLLWAREEIAQSASDKVRRRLRTRLFDHLLTLGPAYTRSEHSGELSTALVEGVEALDPFFRQYLPQLVTSALVPLIILAFILPIDWITALVLLLTAPLIPFFMWLIGRTTEQLTQQRWTTLSRMSSHFLDSLQGLKTLKALGHARRQSETIAEVSDRFRITTLRVLRVAFLSALVLEMTATISTAIVAVEIGLRLLAGRLLFQQALFVLLLAPEFYLPLRLLGTHFHAGMSGVAAAERIYAVLDTKPLARSSQAQHRPPPDPPLRIRFERVGLTHADRTQPALQDVSLTLQAGTTTALVGPSGAGKTSIAMLLLRFYEPDCGEIFVNDAPLHSLQPDAWRKRIAWVPQRPTLFFGTIAENIRLADPSAGMARVQAAAQFAEAHDFIQRLPQGYGTHIGERGLRLSGGQLQRLALARAFLKDAPLVVLDEATANLDPDQQASLHTAIDRLLLGRTALVIAHHLAFAAKAHHVVVLQDGRVVEAGTHEHLASSNGVYARLVDFARHGASSWRPA